jgi:hypothetical protein
MRGESGRQSEVELRRRLPDPARDAPEGVRAYASSPVVLDSINRGALTGKRVDRIT